MVRSLAASCEADSENHAGWSWQRLEQAPEVRAVLSSAGTQEWLGVGVQGVPDTGGPKGKDAPSKDTGDAVHSSGWTGLRTAGGGRCGTGVMEDRLPGLSSFPVPVPR